jgi:hypothetical protein
MTTPVCRVTSCDHPVTDAWVCQRCAHALERALGDIPAVIHQLNLTLAKQTRYADRNERGGNEQPLPMDPLASEAIGQLRAHLVQWASFIQDERAWVKTMRFWTWTWTERGHTIPIVETLSRPANLDILSRWMLHHVEWLRHHEAGKDAVEELTGDMRTARRVIDVPANRTTFPVGPCPEALLQPSLQTTGPTATTTFAVSATAAAITVHAIHCPGEVRAYIPNTDTQPARLECNTCHTIWEAYQWMRLGKRIKDLEATMKGTAA